MRADNKHGQSGQACKDGIDGRSQSSSQPVAHEFIECGKGSVWTPATQVMKPERTNQLPSSDERKEGGIIGSNWNNIYSGEDEPRSKGFFSPLLRKSERDLLHIDRHRLRRHPVAGGSHYNPGQ